LVEAIFLHREHSTGALVAAQKVLIGFCMTTRYSYSFIYIFGDFTKFCVRCKDESNKDQGVYSLVRRMRCVSINNYTIRHRIQKRYIDTC
jgi:hypothetical protein